MARAIMARAIMARAIMARAIMARATCTVGGPGPGKSGEGVPPRIQRPAPVPAHKQQFDDGLSGDVGTADRVAVQARFLDQRSNH